MNKVISFLSITTISISTAAVNPAVHAQGSVQFNLESRGPGAGYNHTMMDRRVAQPKSILKGSVANRAIHNEQRFLRQLGPNVRDDMRHRGDVVRHTRQNGKIKATLSQKARIPRTRYDVRKLSPEVRQNLNKRGNVARQARVNSHMSGAASSKTQTPRVRFETRLRVRGASYSPSSPRNRTTKPKGILKNKNTLNTVKRGRKLRTLGKVAAGGVMVAGATVVAETALGVDIPDAIDAVEWTYGTFKDPRKAPRRFNKLGRDSLRTLDKAGRSLTNPNKMAKNLENGAKKAAKSISKAGCSVGKLFGAKC
ncbi:MAG: hypothetical protein KZQ90_07370 [Candidatus Thiodiazotropha sp. (ex Codakia rugifera)]|nr:hypothetical protein [Candidatus Thiodiazotropha sp. (ex Codakia rugifera)]